LARISTVARRFETSTDENKKDTLVCSRIKINTNKKIVEVDGKVISLT